MSEIVRPLLSPAAVAAAALPLPAIGRSPHNAPDHHEHPAAQTPLMVPASPQGVTDIARMLAGHWDALATALRAVPNIADAVPHPVPELTAQIVALLGALKRGTLADWIGPEAQRALPESVAVQLNDDFARMARLNIADHGAWRFVPIPLLIEDMLGQALLFTHGKRRRGVAPEDDPGMRILLEFETAAHGRLQLDGLVHGQRFDLILRSRAVLPSETRDAVSGIFDEVRALASLAGDISFIAGRDFVVPPVAAEAHSSGVTV